MKNTNTDFSGKIKPECKAYIWRLLAGSVLIPLGWGAVLLYGALQEGVQTGARVFLWALCLLCLLAAGTFPMLTLFAIRRYPAHKGIRRATVYSDWIFVGCEECPDFSWARLSAISPEEMQKSQKKHREYKQWKKRTKEESKAAAGQIADFLRAMPRGQVISYAQAAKEIGCSVHAVTAYIYSAADESVPVHKVLGLEGQLLPDYPFGGILAQKRLLEEEGIEVRNSRVQLGRYRYKK